MAEGSFISYYRVSTVKQGRSGLGLDAQRHAVEAFLNGKGTVIREFVEIESGKNSDRPELADALRYAELTKTPVIVAKLDRLSRDAAFLMRLHKNDRVKVVFADMPFADTVMIGVMAIVAQWEAEQISKRTKEALQAVKRRGTALGGDRGNLSAISAQGRSKSLKSRQKAASERAEKVMHFVAEAKAGGAVTYAAIAAHLNEAGIQTARGKSWHPATVQKIVAKHA